MIGQQTVAEALKAALAKEYELTTDTAELIEAFETPKDSGHGDIAFPCFQLARALKRPPPAIAAQLAETLKSVLPPGCEVQKVEAAGPYLNFYVDKASLAAALIPAILSGEFIAPRATQAERVMVEFGNVNTHKSFHVGHIRNTALGDSIARMFEWAGYPTVRAAYLGDEGTHVAKCLWYLSTHLEMKMPETNRLEFLGEAYSKAALQLDIASYSRVTTPGYKTALVQEVASHPTEELWLVATLKTDQGVVSVVTQRKNGRLVTPGAIVPHAPPGTVVGSRQIGIADKKGVTSYGLMLGNQELGIGDENEVLALSIPERFNANHPDGIGIDLVELFRFDDALPGEPSILARLKSWTAEVSQILQRLEGNDPELKKLWEETREISLDELKICFEWLNTKFDHYFFESEYGESSKVLVREYQKRGVFIESEGAVGADLQQYKLGFCVLIKRDGTALYATRDLVLAQRKFEEFHIDRSVYVVDAAQTLHFQQVFKCLELMGYDQVKKCFHCSYAQVVRPDGKMSSRKGNVILMSELQKLLLSSINREFLDKYEGEWPEDERREAARRIALGTIRYGMLNQDNNSLITFDLESWTSKTGNTGPYMMYAYARTRSILRELGDKTFDWSTVNWSLLAHDTEIDVLRHLREYHETLQQARERYSPHLVCGYVYELAKRFSRMYMNCSVLHAETPELQAARAGLVAAAGAVIQHALGLVGIETVERM